MRNNSKYPWDKWLRQRKTFTLKKGLNHDYSVSSKCMAQQIRNRCTKEGLLVRIEAVGKTKLKVKVIHA